MKFKKKFFSLVIVVMCCLFAFSGCSLFTFEDKTSGNKPYEPDGDNTQIEIEENNTAAELAQKYIDISFTICIVKVEKTTVGGNVNTTRQLYSYGSGFVVHTGGYILTNHHVISDVLKDPVIDGTKQTSYECYVSQDGGKTAYPAEILWENSTFDMAIIVCEKFANLPAATLKDRTIYCSEEEKIGLLEDVITVGNQKSYHASATMGKISSTNLRIAISETNFLEHLIQHYAPINHGNSGGALIDMEGNVIGLNTLGDDEANSLFFAVSIYPAIAVLDKVVENYTSTGSKTEEIVLGFTGTDSLRDSVSANPIGFDEKGLYVVSVENNCLINGLKAGDVIIGVEIETNEGLKNFDVWDNNSLLYARINMLYAKNATFKINRGGSIVELTIAI